MSSDVAIRIEGLQKAYTIKRYEQQITLAEEVLQRLRHPFRRAPVETFWALQGIDLEVRRGEVLGLIGRNGAGKSTLLKVLSRITPPTNGRVDIYGRVGSLLEVGTGFHPELTGRENVYLNGSILGMRRSEIDRQFDAIVEFAGVEQFLDTPVKRYSSGMYVRLAFAVAAHLETEILLVDEVLAVGDQEFQDRCIGKMRDVTTAGRTAILVSHNLSTVRRLAERCVLLDRGSIVAEGEAALVLDTYSGLSTNAWTAEISPRFAGERRAAHLVSVQLVSNPGMTSGEPIVFDLEAAVNSGHATRLAVGTTLRSLGAPVGAALDVVELPGRGEQQCVVRVSIASDSLAPGRYTLSVSVGALGERHTPAADDVAHDVLAIDVAADSESNWLLRNWEPSYGSVCLDSTLALRQSGVLRI